MKDGAKEVQGKDIAPVVKKAEGIILDGTADEVSVGMCFIIGRCIEPLSLHRRRKMRFLSSRL